jgi:sugar-specific transcriptional regulator TrmB
MEHDLRKLGLTEKEIKVYLTVVRIGETSVGGVINELKIHRQIVYTTLDSLERRNMVVKTLKNGIYRFKISDPQLIVENIKKQEMIAKRLAEAIQSESQKDPKEGIVEIYEGIENIRRFYINKFKATPKNSCFYVLAGYAKKFEEVLGEHYLYNVYNKLRRERKIFSKHLYTEDFREESIEQYKRLDDDKNNKLRQYRFLPFHLTNPVTTTIYPDSITYQLFFQKPMIIEIKNQELSDSYRQYYDNLWKIAKD